MEKGLEVTKRVTIEGYLELVGMFKHCSDTCNVDLFSKPGATGKQIILSLKVGDDPNEMEMLPQKFSGMDLKVHTNDNKIVGTGAKVRVTGGRAPVDGRGAPNREMCALWNVDLIEAL
jgi:hypothetical protein